LRHLNQASPDSRLLRALLSTLVGLLSVTGNFWLFAQELAATKPDPVRFVSYNLKNYLKMDRRVGGELRKAAPKPEEEIAKLVELLVATKPDIVGVCEIGDQADLSDLQKRLKEAGLDLPHSAWVNAADRTRHVAALSRFPIASTDHQEKLQYRMDEKEFDFQRGILDATVQVNPNYQLRLLGIHLKSKRKIYEGDQALMRRNEAHLLRAHVDKILEENGRSNILLYGDFNDTQNEAPIKAIKGRFGSERYMRDIQVADKDGYRWTYYWRYADQYSRFDFAFVSKGLYPEVVQEQSLIQSHSDWFTASDHRPVVITVLPVDAEVGSVKE
jgi:endonuclease/exonuclease/phosphatase family metal-dependent hydrolase